MKLSEVLGFCKSKIVVKQGKKELGVFSDFNSFVMTKNVDLLFKEVEGFKPVKSLYSDELQIEVSIKK